MKATQEYKSPPIKSIKSAPLDREVALVFKDPEGEDLYVSVGYYKDNLWFKRIYGQPVEVDGPFTYQPLYWFDDAEARPVDNIIRLSK